VALFSPFPPVAIWDTWTFAKDAVVELILRVDIVRTGNNMVLLCLPLRSNSTKYVPRS
jgi:hypothetical protein